jgi:crotonobetainyl-CoA:carnitine CoA-transferase CaiB-like acyl-CoA transferase
LCRVLGGADLSADPELRDAAGRRGARERIDAAVTEWLAGREAGEAMETLQSAGVPAAAMLRVTELPTFPYYVERDFFRLTGHPAIQQSFHLENAPVGSRHLPDPPDRPAPLLGEHTDQIVAERPGLGEAEIASLVERNVPQPLRSSAAQQQSGGK